MLAPVLGASGSAARAVATAQSLAHEHRQFDRSLLALSFRMYRFRAMLMMCCLALGFYVVQHDRVLSREVGRERADLGDVTRSLKQQLADLRARRMRLEMASQNLTAERSAEECTRKMPALRHTSVVYTWVNGSDAAYRELRKKHGGPGVIGGARDRSIDELRYSIRSLVKYVPWLEGQIYIVSPGQTPTWLAQHPRVTVVDQDALFLAADGKRALPTFNTNAIEVNLWRVPNLTEMFLHINDDYIFGAPIIPEDFFGVGCRGLRLFFEENIIKRPRGGHISHLGIWKRAVLTTRSAIDHSVVAQRPSAAVTRRWQPYTVAAPEGTAWGGRYYYLKHAPFVYSRSVMRLMNTLFRKQILHTYEHKFRHGEDVITPLLHHAIAAGKWSRCYVGTHV